MSPDRRRATGSGAFVLLGLRDQRRRVVLVAAGSPDALEIPGATAERVFTSSSRPSAAARSKQPPPTPASAPRSSRRACRFSAVHSTFLRCWVSAFSRCCSSCARSPAVRWGASRSSGPRAPPRVPGSRVADANRRATRTRPRVPRSRELPHVTGRSFHPSTFGAIARAANRRHRRSPRSRRSARCSSPRAVVTPGTYVDAVTVVNETPYGVDVRLHFDGESVVHAPGPCPPEPRNGAPRGLRRRRRMDVHLPAGRHHRGRADHLRVRAPEQRVADRVPGRGDRATDGRRADAGSQRRRRVDSRSRRAPTGGCSRPTSSSTRCPASACATSSKRSRAARVCVVMHHSGRRDVYVLGTRRRRADRGAHAHRRAGPHARRGASAGVLPARDRRGDRGGRRRPAHRLGHAPRGSRPAPVAAIAELEIRRRTKMTVAAILRGVGADRRARTDRGAAGRRSARRDRPAGGPARASCATSSASEVDRVGDQLVALGGAFLAAGVLARFGRRVGLPTIPFFMLAGIIFGPNTPGHRARRRPRDRSSCSPRSGSSCCCSTSASSSRSATCSRAAHRCSTIGGIYLAAERRRWARVRLRARLGTARGARDRRRGRHLVVGDRHQAADRAAPARQPREPADPRASSSSRTSSSPCTSRCSQPVLGEADGAAEAISQFGAAFAFLLVLTAIARFGAAARRPAHRRPPTTSC